MKDKVKIGEKKVGSDEPTFIIAEAGSNHNQDLDQAKKLIDVAAESGADAVKFQTYSAETLYSKKTPNFSYLEDMGFEKSPYNLMKNIELPREWQEKLAEYTKNSDLLFLSTPFDEKAIDELDPIVPAYKWASYTITDLPLLKKAAKRNKPMLISTGMSDLSEVQEALNAVRSTGNDQIVLLHCISQYPTEPQQANLRMMDTIRDVFHLPTGFSDHTMGLSVPLAAVARGADVIEKHFTLDREMEGPDHPFAMEPEELNKLVSSIREVEQSLGSPIKRGLEEEKEMKKLGRRSIVAKKEIPEGRIIEEDMITTKRPGYGIEPKFIDIVCGREAKESIEEDEVITWEKV